jgi:hypothetical protein
MPEDPKQASQGPVEPRPGSHRSRRAFLAGALATVGLAAVARRLLEPSGGNPNPRPATPTAKAAGPWPPPLCGINVNDRAAYSARLATFGRIGTARVFHSGMLPVRWTWVNDGLSDSRRSQVSFKVPPAALASGTYDATITSWLDSIPHGWTVWLTFWHEPNNELRDGAFTPADFLAAWHRLSRLVRTTSASRPDRVVLLVPTFSRYLLDTSGWSDGWVPAPSDVDFISWDVYGNPTGGAGLGSSYPPVPPLVDTCLRVTQRLGYQHWGISEFNTPRRTWDTDESQRVKWLETFRSYCCDSSRSTASELRSPEIFQLWEGVGSGWDESFMTPATVDWWRSVIKNSP